ncbi:hypothetical protein [Rhodococcoides corynebacterioides]|uniref:hypothetical protein n=1 Tax=Rhodococcoides corynebacterioides TaxID=53972 RepID=UPI001114E965|nr:hypothetical protein [Rhodococcus corynebacterioides]
MASALLAAFAVSCASDTDQAYPGGDATGLPDGAIAAVLVGPRGLESISDQDRSVLFFFDEKGDVKGRVEGGALTGNRVITGTEGVVTAAAGSVTSLTGPARDQYDTGLDSPLQAAASSAITDSTTLWFDVGVVDQSYRSNFVSISDSAQMKTGSVEGIVGTTGYCGDRNVAVVRQSFVGGDETPTRNSLYSMAPNSEPLALSEWDFDPEFRPVTSVSPCSGDGRYLYSLYASADTVAAETQGPGLVLVKFDTTDGAVTQTQLSMPGYTWSTHRSSLAIIDDRLYWVSHDEDVLSIALDGSSRVEKLWSLPNSASIVVQANNNLLSTVSSDDEIVFNQYELKTGEPVRPPIVLPWLGDVEGRQTEGGGTIYKIVDTSALSTTGRR